MKSNSRPLMIVVSLISAFLLSGCFQSMSNDADPTPVSELFATPTPLPPSQTPQPTFTPFPSQDVIERVVTATPDLTLSAQPTQFIEPTQPQMFDPTPTSEAVAFVTAEPTEFDALAADAQSEQQQQPEPTATISEALQEATRIIAEATQRSIDATETARGPITVPTITPTPDAVFPPTATTTGPTTTTPGGTCTYTIRAGDNLFRLSLQYDVLVMDIARANNITNPQLIVVGDEIVIPNCNTAGGSFGQSGTGTTGGTTASCNSSVRHTVQQGETLFEISMQYNVTVADIARCNNIPDPNFVLMTTELVIPQ